MRDDLATAGWMVKATTPAIGGGGPIERWFVSGAALSHDAEIDVRNHAGDSDIVKAHRELSSTEITALKLKPYEVRQYV